MQEHSWAGRTNGVSVPQLAFLRRQVDLSQCTLAERTQVSRQTINRLERGANARFDTIALLAKALKVTSACLIKRPRQNRTQAVHLSPAMEPVPNPGPALPEAEPGPLGRSPR